MGRGDHDHPDISYRAGSVSSLSSESEWRHRHDQCTQKHDQFEQSMIAINNSLTNSWHCQQQTQNDATHALQVIHQSHRIMQMTS